MRAIKLAGLLIPLLAVAALAEDKRRELNTTLKTLEKTKQNEAAIRKQIEESEQALKTLRAKATDLAADLQNAEREGDRQEAALAKANATYAKKREEFELRKSDYGKTVMALLRLRRIPPTAMIASSEDPEVLLRTASALEHTNHAVAEKAARLRADMAQLKTLQVEAKAREAASKKAAAAISAKGADLARELRVRQQKQETLGLSHAKTRQKIAELSRNSQSLQELLSKLKAHEKEDPAPRENANLRAFDGKRGAARVPVSGSILHRFGEKQPANGTYRGMVFKTRPGAAVVAPYDGTVAFAGPFRDYGNMVLIKHKNGFISLIAGLGSIDVSLHQTAARGEPIGSMPGTGASEAYVELRGPDAKPIDPANWFANVGA